MLISNKKSLSIISALDHKLNCFMSCYIWQCYNGTKVSSSPLLSSPLLSSPLLSSPLIPSLFSLFSLFFSLSLPLFLSLYLFLSLSISISISLSLSIILHTIVIAPEDYTNEAPFAIVTLVFCCSVLWRANGVFQYSEFYSKLSLQCLYIYIYQSYAGKLGVMKFNNI